MTRERLIVGAVHYAAGPIGRVSHGLRVVVTAPAGHGATPRSRQLSARIISFLESVIRQRLVARQMA